MVDRAQIEHEHQEIEAAPAVASGPFVGRCSFCGALAHDLRLVETLAGVERYKGECCQ